MIVIYGKILEYLFAFQCNFFLKLTFNGKAAVKLIIKRNEMKLHFVYNNNNNKDVHEFDAIPA